MPDEYVNLTEQEKLDLRPGLSRIVGALMRAWWLDMYSARTPEEQDLLRGISELVGARPESPGGLDETPLALRVDGDPAQDERLVPLADAEFLAVFDDLVARYKAMGQAYRRGMIRAANPDQKRQLTELEELLT